jgi:transcriptional regulator with XRE-family HTH domain
MAGNHKRPHKGQFYEELGHNLRIARVAAGKTQTDIADYLDVTCQQVQKYESGMNRIPVDCLVSFAAYLQVPLAQFIDPSASDSGFQSLAEKLGDRDFCTLMEVWGSIKDHPARAALVELVKRTANLWR